jgi:hypothetical protein
MAGRTDAIGTTGRIVIQRARSTRVAPQIEEDIRLAYARNVRKEPLVLLAGRQLSGGRSIDRGGVQLRNPFLEVSQNAP